MIVPTPAQYRAMAAIAAWRPPDGVRVAIVYEPRTGRLGAQLSHADETVLCTVHRPERPRATLTGLHVEATLLVEHVRQRQEARWN